MLFSLTIFLPCPFFAPLRRSRHMSCKFGRQSSKLYLQCWFQWFNCSCNSGVHWRVHGCVKSFGGAEEIFPGMVFVFCFPLAIITILLQAIYKSSLHPPCSYFLPGSIWLQVWGFFWRLIYDHVCISLV